MIQIPALVWAKLEAAAKHLGVTPQQVLLAAVMAYTGSISRPLSESVKDDHAKDPE